MTVTELRDMLHGLGVPGVSSKRKPELIVLLEDTLKEADKKDQQASAGVV